MKMFSDKIDIVRDNLSKCKFCVYLYICDLVQEKHWVNAENFTRLNLATEQSTTHTDALTSNIDRYSIHRLCYEHIQPDMVLQLPV